MSRLAWLLLKSCGVAAVYGDSGTAGDAGTAGDSGSAGGSGSASDKAQTAQLLAAMEMNWSFSCGKPDS
jgi:hypothetical protein